MTPISRHGGPRPARELQQCLSESDNGGAPRAGADPGRPVTAERLSDVAAGRRDHTPSAAVVGLGVGGWGRPSESESGAARIAVRLGEGRDTVTASPAIARDAMRRAGSSGWFRAGRRQLALPAPMWPFSTRCPSVGEQRGAITGARPLARTAPRGPSSPEPASPGRAAAPPPGRAREG
jgi:hypothetical protein